MIGIDSRLPQLPVASRLSLCVCLSVSTDMARTLSPGRGGARNSRMRLRRLQAAGSRGQTTRCAGRAAREALQRYGQPHKGGEWWAEHGLPHLLVSIVAGVGNSLLMMTHEYVPP